MLTYSRTQLGTYHIRETDEVHSPCDRLDIERNGQSIASLYLTSALGVAVLSEGVFRIEKQMFKWKQSKYEVVNQANGVRIATLEWAPLLSDARKIGSLIFENGTVYPITQRLSHRKLLRPKTWKLYHFEMEGGHHKISFMGERQSGDIEPGGETNLLAIACGLYMMNEQIEYELSAG
jgi:hypothetical protein